MTSFSIGVLCYGNFPELAKRCLESIQLSVSANHKVVKDVRIGMNQCSSETWKIVRTQAMQMPVPVYSFTTHGEAYKYPIMRIMLYRSLPIHSTHWMWFDDDSYVKPGTDAEWLTALADKLDDARDSISLLGYRYYLTKGFRAGQVDGIKRQGWYDGRPVHEKRAPFFQGGWWAASYSLMQSWSYPFRELRHNNGDVLLGQLSYQQRWKELVIPEASGPVASNKAPRRGIKDTPWPWQKNAPTDLEHHNIRITVDRLNPSGNILCPPNLEIKSETQTSILA